MISFTPFDIYWLLRFLVPPMAVERFLYLFLKKSLARKMKIQNSHGLEVTVGLNFLTQYYLTLLKKSFNRAPGFPLRFFDTANEE